MSEKLARIESALAHLERLYDELNQVVIEQGKSLAKLTSQHDRLSESLSAIELERVKSTNPKPPHYQ